VFLSVSVLGRVDEKCTQHEQSNVTRHAVKVTDTQILQPPPSDKVQHLVATENTAQELQHVEADSGQNNEETKKKFQGDFHISLSHAK